jgi:anti-sigma regulatory factor (Ser/Thr protein kinase)
VRLLAETFGAAVGADHSVTLRVVLVLEELFTNTVTHGYSDSGEGPVWVTLAAGASVIEITYEDAGPAFDPLTEAPALPLSAEGQAPGGLGLALVRGLSASAAYARIGDRNRVTLTVSIETSPPPEPAPPQ